MVLATKKFPNSAALLAEMLKMHSFNPLTFGAVWGG
jgi:hypothetical protein